MGEQKPKSMQKLHRTCEVCGVKERHSAEKLFLARFPLNEYRCKEWLKVVGNIDLVHIPIEKLHDLRYVCGRHFEKKDFTKSRTRLKKRAIPKLHLSATPLPEECFEEFPLHKFSVSLPAQQDKQEQQCLAPSTSKAGLLPQPSCEAEKSITKKAINRKPETEIMSLPAKQNKQEQQYLVPSSSKAGLLPQPSCEAEKSITKETIKRKPETEIVSLPAQQDKQEQQCLAPSTSKAGLLPQPSCEAEISITKQTVKRKSDTYIEVTPKKKKLMAQLKKTKMTLASLKKSANILENLSSSVLKEFVISGLKNQKRKPQGKRWTTKNKISALAIFKRSPKAYRYLQHVMELPSVKTLTNILKKIPMEPGINNVVIKHLMRLSKNTITKDRFCVLCFDEMALKPRLIYNPNSDKVEGFTDFGEEDERSAALADHALVFLLQGIRKKFKQPIAYYFTKDTVSSQKLATLIKQIIESINATGFQIIATVCDQGSTNRGALTMLKEWHNGGENYFKLNGETIYIIYDVPHLFKNIRNNFLKNGRLVMDGRTANWRDLEEVEEQNRNFLYMTKISATHVKPKYSAKMRVKYAAQVLSQTVAAVLKLLSKWKENESRSNEIMETALIVEELNKLFDFTNGPSSAEDIKKGIRENVSEKTNHLNVWCDFRKKLENLRFIDRNGVAAKNVKCIEGYITTLKSLRDLWTFVNSFGFKYLNLRQLNQDALENLFGLIRQHSPTNKHPTCSTFTGALKTSIISGMTAPHSRGSNCEKDFKNLLTDFHDLIFNASTEEYDAPDPAEPYQTKATKVPEEKTLILSIPDIDMEFLEIDEDLSKMTDQPLIYVSGYIASILLKQNSCTMCKESLSITNFEESTNAMYDLIRLREWWTDKQSLTYPSTNLCHTVNTAKNIFEHEVIPYLHRSNLCQWVITLFYANCHVAWFCPHHAHEKVHYMFSRLGLLFIRRQCQRINIPMALKEENLADATKKGQQLGLTK